MTGGTELLAAEYALGVLTSDERLRVVDLMASDQACAQAVRRWERRLGELHVLVDAVEPPPELWDRIKTAAVSGSDEGRDARTPPRVALWRGAAAGFAILAAILTGIGGVALRAPTLLPDLLRPTAQAGEATPAVDPASASATPVRPDWSVAVLQPDAAAPGFVLTVDVAERRFVVRRIAVAPQSGKVHQLWLVSDRLPGPRSLGLIGEDDAEPRSLIDFDAATIAASTFAVSEEPPEGAPSGVPSGPVLFSGRLVEAPSLAAP